MFKVSVRAKLLENQLSITNQSITSKSTQENIYKYEARPLRFAQTPTWHPAVMARRLAPRLARQG